MAERITRKHVQTALERLVNVLAKRDPTARIATRYDEPGYRIEHLYGGLYRVQLRVIEPDPHSDDANATRMYESEPFGARAYHARELYEAIDFAVQVLYTEREAIDRQAYNARDAAAAKVLNSVAKDLDGVPIAVDENGRIMSVSSTVR